MISKIFVTCVSIYNAASAWPCFFTPRVFLFTISGADLGFCEGGLNIVVDLCSRGSGGAQPSRSYKLFQFYGTKILPNASLRHISMHLRKYKEFSSPYMEWGCGGCNHLRGVGCFIL